MAHEIASLHLPVLNIGGLFRTEKIPKMLATNVNGALSVRPSTPSPPPGVCSSNSGGKLYAAAVDSFYPTSAAQLMARPDSPAGGRRLRRINPNLVSFRKKTAPCIILILMSILTGIT